MVILDLIYLVSALAALIFGTASAPAKPSSTPAGQVCTGSICPNPGTPASEPSQDTRGTDANPASEAASEAPSSLIDAREDAR